MALDDPTSNNTVQIHSKTRLLVRLASYTAAIMAGLKPIHLRTVLTLIRGNARPATIAEATVALSEVTHLVPRTRGVFGCLPKSLAAVLVLRVRGAWATWCVGVRTQPPFAAHAWIEAESQVIQEKVDGDSLITLFRVTSRRESELRS